MTPDAHSLLAHIPLIKGDVVSIVGSGGKTTLMFVLAHELTAQGFRVITTTTTRIFVPAAEECSSVITEEDGDILIDKTTALLQRERHITVAAARWGEKLKGLAPRVVNAMRRRAPADVILVEGDGARGRPLKAPNETEPVVPTTTTWLLGVLGLDGIGKPNTDEFVFRPDRFHRLSGIEVGGPVTPEAAVSVLLHPDGVLRKTPPEARIIVVLNQGDSPERLATGKKLAQLIIQQAHPLVAKALVVRLLPSRAVLFSNQQSATKKKHETTDNPQPVISGILLAAGESRRMGKPKLLMPWGDTTMIEHVVDTYLKAGLHELIVVVGAHKDGMRQALAPRPVTIVDNTSFQEGMSTSLRCGVASASDAAGAYLVALADQPLVTAEIIHRLIAEYSEKKPLIAVAAHQGRRGHPVIFSKTLRSELMELEGDEGGRSIIERYASSTDYVEVESDAIFADVDSVDDYRRIGRK